MPQRISPLRAIYYGYHYCASRRHYYARAADTQRRHMARCHATMPDIDITPLFIIFITIFMSAADDAPPFSPMRHFAAYAIVFRRR